MGAALGAAVGLDVGPRVCPAFVGLDVVGRAVGLTLGTAVGWPVVPALVGARDVGAVVGALVSAFLDLYASVAKVAMRICASRLHSSGKTRTKSKVTRQVILLKLSSGMEMHNKPHGYAMR